MSKHAARKPKPGLSATTAKALSDWFNEIAQKLPGEVASIVLKQNRCDCGCNGACCKKPASYEPLTTHGREWEQTNKAHNMDAMTAQEIKSLPGFKALDAACKKMDIEYRVAAEVWYENSLSVFATFYPSPYSPDDPWHVTAETRLCR